MDTNLSQTIDITTERARYDEYIKEILSDKQILARILKYTLEEFQDTDIDTIIANIDEPEVSKVRVEPGHTNTETIKGAPTEDNVPGEGKIFFDIRFSAYSKDELIKILINIEAQKSTNTSKLGYHLDNRIIYYLGRMISAQKEVEFAKSDYDNLKPVRSIWICMDAGDNEDSINRIRFVQNTVFGKDIEFSNINKVQGIIIRLRSNENVAESKNSLIAMLEELLKSEPVDIKKHRLSENFGLKMSIDTERRLGEMCNLSQVLIDQGEEKGRAKGREEGKLEGREEGREEGKVVARFEDGMNIETIAHKSQLSVERVKAILKEEGLIS